MKAVETWEKLGRGWNGSIEYGIWRNFTEEQRFIYRVQRSPIIPQGNAGYYNLESHLGLCGVKMEKP
jgi:hypothetical protein